MARLPRMDRPGAWFHVMNRGIARRVVFPDRLHNRVLLACLLWEVRRGDLEIHAFCVMPTHFHVLVRSLTGRLSVAVGRALNAYVRWYNRRARRDGPLFRGRFTSRPVLSLRYRDVLVRYIEHNPVQAGIVGRAGAYPYASASYQGAARRPRWLATWWVDEVLALVQRVDPAATYASLWGAGISQAERDLTELRTRRPACTEDALDDLVGGAPACVQAWMRRKARLADGGGARPVLVDPRSVLAVVGETRRRLGPWTQPSRRGPPRELWAPATLGLLHALSGLTLRECAGWAQRAPGTAVELLARHRRMMRDPGYALRLCQMAAECIRRVHARGAALPHGRAPSLSAKPLERVPEDGRGPDYRT